MLADSEAFSGFSVQDPQAARAFYEDVLGLSTDDDAGGMFWLRLAGARRVLVYPSPGHRAASYTVLNFPVADIESTVDELASRGVEFARFESEHMSTDAKGINRSGGPLIAWFTDPSGNTLSVLEQRPTEQTEEHA